MNSCVFVKTQTPSHCEIKLFSRQIICPPAHTQVLSVQQQHLVSLTQLQ